ncbi:S-adenosyl-L-methionine-dependent methyltransferase [Aspergillus pseudodeflectus]|uniref:S-adenosyl-L-methionine-dependent methyltransferase n=1 Tax=Aspergillus pseudodeflectus TaxID=176178 RepID=A0ABR4L7C2_9EURO
MSALRPLRPLLRSSWTPARRTYASQTPGNPVLEIFNRKTKQLQKDRAAQNVEESRKVDYLKDEVAMRLCERLLDIKRTFPNVLDLGANSCNIARALTTPIPNLDPETGAETSDATTLSDRIGNLTCVETSPALLNRDAELPFNRHLSISREVIPNLESLPYQPNSFDAVLSSLSLHWINDLPSLLAQVNSILKPDCPFIAAMFGGDTLFELRTSLQLADLERRGGVSPHVSPLADVRDVGGLLTKAGFKMLTVDVEDIVVEFPDTFALMADLQAMGENNAIMQREAGPISRDVLLANEAIYRELHKEEESRGIPATFRLIYMIGWKEGEGQAQPLARGSGQVNLKDILGGGDFRP